MPNLNAPVTSSYSGWYRDQLNAALELYYAGTKVGTVTAALLAVTGAMTASTTITAGTGVTVTTGDLKVTAGNERLGAISTFATTEPTSALVMKVGTNPVGAITTSGAIFTTTGGATISKIIADGTVSQVET